jgi:hypothetical protein
VPCFSIEDSELRLAAFTVYLLKLPVSPKWMVLVYERRQWENQRGDFGLVATICFVCLKITEPCELSDWLDVTTHSWFLCSFLKITQYEVPHIEGQQRTPYEELAILEFNH